jgi:hypothetical protein
VFLAFAAWLSWFDCLNSHRWLSLVLMKIFPTQRLSGFPEKRRKSRVIRHCSVWQKTGYTHSNGTCLKCKNNTSHTWFVPSFTMASYKSSLVSLPNWKGGSQIDHSARLTNFLKSSTKFGALSNLTRPNGFL